MLSRNENVLKGGASRPLLSKLIKATSSNGRRNVDIACVSPGWGCGRSADAD